MPMTDPLNIVLLPAREDKMGETLSRLRSYVSEMCEMAGVEKQKMHRLRLAIDEIATNIILHAYEPEDGILKVSSTLDDNVLTISLEDSGTAFDPTQREMPDDLDEPLESRDIGGLGIYLAINGVDEFRYERAEGCNRNHFSVKRH